MLLIGMTFGALHVLHCNVCMAFDFMYSHDEKTSFKFVKDTSYTWFIIMQRHSTP